MEYLPNKLHASLCTFTQPERVELVLHQIRHRKISGYLRPACACVSVALGQEGRSCHVTHCLSFRFRYLSNINDPNKMHHHSCQASLSHCPSLSAYIPEAKKKSPGSWLQELRLCPTTFSHRLAGWLCWWWSSAYWLTTSPNRLVGLDLAATTTNKTSCARSLFLGSHSLPSIPHASPSVPFYQNKIKIKIRKPNGDSGLHTAYASHQVTRHSKSSRPHKAAVG